jgi:hypothetical protein
MAISNLTLGFISNAFQREERGRKDLRDVSAGEDGEERYDNPSRVAVRCGIVCAEVNGGVGVGKGYTSKVPV